MIYDSYFYLYPAFDFYTESVLISVPFTVYVFNTTNCICSVTVRRVCVPKQSIALIIQKNKEEVEEIMQTKVLEIEIETIDFIVVMRTIERKTNAEVNVMVLSINLSQIYYSIVL